MHRQLFCLPASYNSKITEIIIINLGILNFRYHVSKHRFFLGGLEWDKNNDNFNNIILRRYVHFELNALVLGV